jgi:hypothetical protein
MSGEGGRGPGREAVVAAYLEERSLELAGLYAEARRLLAARSPAGWTSFVGHAGRELMNRLADHEPVPVEDPDRKRGRTGPERYVERLREARESGGPEELAAAAEWIVEDFERGREATADRARALLGAEGAEPQSDMGAWVSRWRGVQRTMLAFTHVPGPSATPRDPEELVRAFSELTDLLAVRVAREPFFDSYDELMEIALVAEPDTEIAGAALARLREGTAMRFFGELAAPAWVAVLAGLGIFAKEPPPPDRDGEYISFPPWPEGQVLRRFAASAPESVAAAARTVPPSENAGVARDLAETALLLPAAEVAGTLARRVATDLKTSARLLGLALTAGGLVGHLARGGEVPSALRLLASILTVEVRSEESGADFLPPRNVGSFTNSAYEVSEAAEGGLGDLLAADAAATFAKLARQLRGAQRRLAVADSTAWRDAVAGPDETAEFEPRHLLLQLVRDVGVHIAEEGDEPLEAALGPLEAEESEIFLRLRMHLLARSALAAIRAAPGLLGDPKVLFGFHYRPEVRELLAAAWPGLDAREQATILELIDAGPDPTRVRIDPEADPEQARRYADDWRLTLLEAIDGGLDAEHQAWLEALGTARGPESPLPPTGWIGPESPSTPNELAAMGADQLFIHLRDFEPERHFAAPSREGLGRELADAVAADPPHFGALVDRIAELRWVYVRAVLQGLKGALENGWKPANDLVLRALEVAMAPPLAPDENHDEQAAAQIVGTDALQVLLRSDPPMTQRERLLALVGFAAESSDPTAERDANAEEPMGLGIGCLRGQAVNLAIEYVAWRHRDGCAGWGEGSEIRELVNGLAGDPARAVRAVIGASLGQLGTIDSDWVAGHRRLVADPGGDEQARAGWEAYLGYGRIDGDLVEILRESYEDAVARLESEPPAETTRNSLAEHVAVIWRDLEERAPGLTDGFLASATDEDKARMIGVLGRALRTDGPGDYDPDEAELGRHRGLWSARLAAEDLGTREAEEFGWFFTSERLWQPEDVERLMLTLKRTEGRIQDSRKTIGLLARLVGENPAVVEAAIAALEEIGTARTAIPQHLREAELGVVLKAGLAEPATEERAQALIHIFGEQGFVTLRALLD